VNREVRLKSSPSGQFLPSSRCILGSTQIDNQENILISPAFAQAAGGGAEAGIMSFLPLILIFAVFYFMAIRPQMKRQKEHKSMVEALQKGDEVIISGGMLGKITKCGDTYLTVEIAELAEKPVEVLIQRAAVTSLLPRSTIKEAR
jgi:preprotein translocase subunit YajC